MYRLMTVGGDDAETFLQGQLTQDIRRVQNTSALPAAWCNPKGRVIATLRIIREDPGFAILLPADIAQSVKNRLSAYVMRSDVTLQLPLPNPAESSGSDIGRFFDHDSLPLKTVTGDATAANEALEKRLIRSAQVCISAENSEKYTPHMLSLDLAGAVSFDKGCYTGQEVVARTEHLGNSRRRLMRYQCDAPHIDIGDALFNREQSVGTVVNASGGDVLAVTPAAMHRDNLTLNGAAARPASLPWT